MTLALMEYGSPIGPLVLVARRDVLLVLAFGEHWPAQQTRLQRRLGAAEIVAQPRLAGIADELDAYFAGDLAALERIAAEPLGTPFQCRVWHQLRAIPAGRPTSYGELARKVGAPSASRAVGAANGANPVAVVLPCHRVIGSNGDMTGYGGGLERKRWLLAHESRFAAAAGDSLSLF